MFSLTLIMLVFSVCFCILCLPLVAFNGEIAVAKVIQTSDQVQQRLLTNADALPSEKALFTTSYS